MFHHEMASALLISLLTPVAIAWASTTEFQNGWN